MYSGSILYLYSHDIWRMHSRNSQQSMIMFYTKLLSNKNNNKRNISATTKCINIAKTNWQYRINIFIKYLKPLFVFVWNLFRGPGIVQPCIQNMLTKWLYFVLDVDIIG